MGFVATCAVFLAHLLYKCCAACYNLKKCGLGESLKNTRHEILRSAYVLPRMFTV